jgi:hypothetical protein
MEVEAEQKDRRRKTEILRGHLSTMERYLKDNPLDEATVDSHQKRMKGSALSLKIPLLSDLLADKAKTDIALSIK